MKAGDIVIAPEGCEDYLTAGDGYKVISVDGLHTVFGHFFEIIDDVGDNILCSERVCLHINEQDWILAPTSQDNPKDNKTITK